MLRFIAKVYYVLTVPLCSLFILSSRRIHPAYGMSSLKKLSVGLRFFYNTTRVQTGTSYKTHLAMLLKLLETPPEVAGDVVECGTWKGGSATNLSVACKIVGRRLKIYDSFEGLPEGEAGDREAKYYKKGDYRGALEEVRSNLESYGEIGSCDFVKGWFDQTLPSLDSPVVLAFFDVDLEASLDTCIRYVWPNLVETGYVFIDEFQNLDYCALFYSEWYWQKHFGRTPPGLCGAGVGLALGEFYIGPFTEAGDHPLQHANAAAYTRKDWSGHWTFRHPAGESVTDQRAAAELPRTSAPMSRGAV